jgi:hypothetical protein
MLVLLRFRQVSGTPHYSSARKKHTAVYIRRCESPPKAGGPTTAFWARSWRTSQERVSQSSSCLLPVTTERLCLAQTRLFSSNRLLLLRLPRVGLAWLVGGRRRGIHSFNRSHLSSVQFDSVSSSSDFVIQGSQVRIAALDKVNRHHRILASAVCYIHYESCERVAWILKTFNISSLNSQRPTLIHK